jgi:hypothetical protein
MVLPSTLETVPNEALLPAPAPAAPGKPARAPAPAPTPGVPLRAVAEAGEAVLAADGLLTWLFSTRTPA